MRERMRLADLIEEIPDEQTARQFVVVGAVTSSVVAIATAVPALMSSHYSWAADSLLFAVVAWRVFRGSRFWSVVGLVVFIAEKILQFILWPLSWNLVGTWVFALLFLCGFVAGVRGTYALLDLRMDDNPYARL
jgi:hypothetical protein